MNSSGKKANPTYRRMIPLLGTYVKLELSSFLPRVQILELMDKMFHSMETVQSLMSYYLPSSDLSKFNQSRPGELTPIHEKTAKVLAFSEKLRAQSYSLFNVGLGDSWTQPVYTLLNHQDKTYCRKTQKGEIDLGGVAKGFAVDEAFEVIRPFFDQGEVTGSINAGGDLFIFEQKPTPTAIRFGTENAPIHRLISIKQGALATSSVQHLPPHSESKRLQYRHPQQNVLKERKTVAVLAHSTMVADALTKVVLVAQESYEYAWAKACLAAFQAKGFYEIPCTL